MNTATALRLSKPSATIDFYSGTDVRIGTLGLDDPALDLLTDFHLTPAISVRATAQIDDALTQMIRDRVRLLFVVDAEFSLLGAITSYDIQGEKPLRYLQSRDCRIGICSREDILVQDIMTPVQKWKVIDFDQLRDATVADVVEAFKASGLRHLIVVDAISGRDVQVVRGLLSLATLERALGTKIESTKVASSFAEIKRALAT